MKYKHSLRFRITFTFFLFGTLLMVAVATGVNYTMEDIEERVIEQNLKKELANFERRYHNNPNQPLPHSASMTTYLVDAENESGLPAYMRGLKPGIYELSHENKVMQVILDRVNGKKIAIELDATLFERREDRIFASLIIAVIAASVLALWLGYALSQKAIAPVTSLAKTVAVLDPNKPAEKLFSHYVNDEVGELARAFDLYLGRLKDFIAREQEFTANASHELRTPLTIIKGAVELLNAEQDLSPRSRKILQRIERASDNMSQMVDTLLVLAREDNMPEEEVTRMSVVTQAVVEENYHLLSEKAVTLEVRINKDFALQVPRSILAILLGNLVRNAIAYTREGDIYLTVDSPFVLVIDTGKGIASEELPRIFERHFRASANDQKGSGLGLSIVKRICDRYGWKIDVDSKSGQGTMVSIDFNKSMEQG